MKIPKRIFENEKFVNGYHYKMQFKIYDNMEFILF